MASLSTQILEHYIDHSNLVGIKKIMAIATRQMTSWTTMIKSQEWQKATTETAKRGEYGVNTEWLCKRQGNESSISEVRKQWQNVQPKYKQFLLKIGA